MVQQTPEFVAFIESEDDRKVAEAVVAKNWPSAAIYGGGVGDAIALVAKGNLPQALLVDFSKSKDAESDARNIREMAPSTILIGVGAVNDVALFRKLLAAGVADYLIKPLQIESLQQAIISAAHFSAGQEKKPGVADLIVLIGARGGVGVSTIAVNCAWTLAEESKNSVALVDLDMHFGSSALALDIEPSPGLREALKNPSRIDSLFVTSALVKATDRLYVLGSEEPIEEEIIPDPTAIALLLSEMRGRFQYVIVDLPHNLLRLYDVILPESNRVFIVSDLSLAGIRDTVRLMNRIRNINPKQDIRIIANRVPSTPVGISAKDFERGIGGNIDFTIHDDGKIAIANNAGKPLSGSSNGISGSAGKTVQTLREICQLIAGKQTAAKKKQSANLLSFLGKKQ